MFQIGWGLSYPNFVRGLLIDGMQPLIDRFEVLGTLCCTICEVPRRAGNQKEVLLRNPWNFVTCRKSKGSIVTQSRSFCNSSKAKKGVIIWSVRFRNLTKRKRISLRNSQSFVTLRKKNHKKEKQMVVYLVKWGMQSPFRGFWAISCLRWKQPSSPGRARWQPPPPFC